MELGVLGPLQVRQDGAPVNIPGAKPRAILTMLGLHNGSVVPADMLIELLWGDDPPRTAAKALQTHISSLRRTLGDGVVVTEGTGWTLTGAAVDAAHYRSVAKTGRDAAAAGDTSQAVARFEEALTLWRGIPELPDGRRGLSEKTRWIEGHAALVEDRADALLATGRAAEIIGDLEAAVAEAPLRERRWGQLMLALYRAGRQGEALGAYQRARSMLADELGVDPGPGLRRLETAIVAQDASLDVAVAQNLPSVTRAVTFLLTDIEGSTAAWETEAEAMAVALAHHDELVEQIVTSRGGRLIKTRGEGDATFSVFERPSAAAAAAIELQEAISHEPWALRDPMRIRVALHTGEVELRDGDYFGRAVNRAARLRSLAAGGQILCSGAIAELVIDALPDDVVLADLGMRQLRNLPRPEHVFELRLQTTDDEHQEQTTAEPIQRPALPTVLVGPGPFVGRGFELERLLAAWQTTLDGGVCTTLIAGEPGVGKTRLAGEWSQRAYTLDAVVLYGRCDEDLGVPYQPFAEALRSLVPGMGVSRLRGLRGVEALLSLIPGLTDLVPDLAPPARADPDTERYALFDAVVALLEVASASAPVVLILDDLHWAAKPTLLLLRHLLRFGDHARVQILGTYRSTDLDRAHPLSAMLADLHRSADSGTANRLSLSGLDEDDVTTYVAEAGYDDQELAHALATVTGGNPFFLIEALRHVAESGGVWDQSTLPQGVREAVSRRLSRLSIETNTALSAAAVVGSRFGLQLVETVVGGELIDAFDEACKAGIVIEEPGGRYRFNHAIVRQSLLAELASVRRMRLHQRIATTLESQPGAGDELLAELAHHYFECAWAGNAAKAVEYCRRAADQAMTRLAYEGAADLYDRALHALEEIDDELSDRDEQTALLLVARCEALLVAGDVASAADAVAQLQAATVDSARLAAWATCCDGQLSMLVHPERLDEVEAALGAAAKKLAGLDDAAGEANAQTIRAGCLARLGRIADSEIALDDALSAARRARENRRVNAVLAGAPLAALWGPNPVPRAGGRCLDVVRLLRITTDSPAVEATSTRCQAILEAFRGRAAAARRMIDSARRMVTELGLRHALLEVEQFAGIAELVADDPAAAETHFRLAYNGFRRMGLDADTAESAALLGRTCLVLERQDEADELCAESERLAGHALKASIAWRTLRARLLSQHGDHADARRVAETAVALAERTDALVDHGDACLTLASVLGAAGDTIGARDAAERAVSLYERKGAAALAEKARLVLGGRVKSVTPAPSEASAAEPDNACVRAIRQLDAAYDHEAWGEVKRLVAEVICVESRRKIVGGDRADLPYSEWEAEARRFREILGPTRYRHAVVAVRGERLALTRLEVGTADVSAGAPRDEFLQLYGLDQEGRIALHVWFDVEDVDDGVAELNAVYARFNEPPRHRLEAATTQVCRRFDSYFLAGDWDALAETLAANFTQDDRRKLMGAGLRQGRDAVMTELTVVANAAIQSRSTDVIATRGTRLALNRVRSAFRDTNPGVFGIDVLDVIEIDTRGRIAARVVFDLEDFDAAIAELDARYLTGEAAAHAPTWSVIARAFSALNRRELPAITADGISIDHRRVAAYAPGELVEYVRAGWELGQHIHTYVEAVHRLNDLGAVCTHVASGASREGFDAEWRGVQILTVDGEKISRSELFEEADLDAAITQFAALSRPEPRLETEASQADSRYWTYYRARDWNAIAEMLADDFFLADNRRVLNAGVLQGREIQIENLKAIAEIGSNITSTVIATRGKRLSLARVRSSNSDLRHGEFDAELLSLMEIDADDRILMGAIFDPGDFDAAIAELDARYRNGEAAGYAPIWSAISDGFAALNRHELPLITSDFVDVDHRRGATIAPGDLMPYLRAGLALNQDARTYVEVVHRLNSGGAVVTNAAHLTSREDFEAEWRTIEVLTVEGELISSCEIFDAADLDQALAKFDELRLGTRRLANAASQAYEHLQKYFAIRDWDAMAETFAEHVVSDDRRPVVNAGKRHGRAALLAEISALAQIGVGEVTTGVIATRSDRLALGHIHFSGPGGDPLAYLVESLGVIEIDSDARIAAIVMFDPDDYDAAIDELEARYLAGEAAPYSHTWSVVTQGFAALNRRELPPTTPDWVNIDHRRGTSIAPGEMHELLNTAWNLTSDLRTFIGEVHRLNSLGAVVTHLSHETSPEGFRAEWRVVSVLTLEGDMLSRCEVFDEADLDAALARFDELNHPAPQLKNRASKVAQRFLADFAAGNWDAVAETLANDFSQDDRRRVVGAGVRYGRDAEIVDLRAIADQRVTGVASTVMAIRGQCLVLMRVGFSFRDHGSEAYLADLLGIAEINADGLLVADVSFDLEDIDAAFDELDARYLAGEAAAHARAWSVIARAYQTFNRRELPPTTSTWVSSDHRPLVTVEAPDMAAYIRDVLQQVPKLRIYVEAVHRLTDTGAVVRHAAHGVTEEGFDAEWRMIFIYVVQGDLVSGFEIFDEADMDGALARFEELEQT